MMVRNSLIYALTAMIKGALGFALIAVYTRHLSADAYGDYAIIIGLINFADMFMFMWLRQGVMRHISDDVKPEDHTYLFNVVGLYSFVMVVVLFISIPVLNMTIGEGQDEAYTILSSLIIAEAFSNLVILVARLRLNLKTFFILNVAKPMLSLGIGSVMIINGFGVWGACLGLLISCAFITVIGMATLPDFVKMIRMHIYDTSRQYSSFAGRVFAGILKRHIKAICAFGLPLILSLSIQSAIKVTDRILLDVLIGGEITGLYAAAQDVPYKLLMLVTSSIHLACYPLALKALETQSKETQSDEMFSKEACQKQLKINFMALFGLLCPAALGVIMTAPFLSTIFLGEAFRPFANAYLPVFTGIAALSCLIQYYFLLGFHIAKRTTLIVIPLVFALIINAGLGIVLIPQYDAVGAMIGSAASYGVLLVSAIVIGRRVFIMPIPLVSAGKVIVATITMGGGLALIQYLMQYGWSDQTAHTQTMMEAFVMLSLYSAVGVVIYAFILWVLNPSDMRQYVAKYMNKAE